MSAGSDNSGASLRIAPVENEKDIEQAFDCTAAAFGRQTVDGIWIAMTPGWDTPEGRQKGIDRLVKRWQSATKDRNGNPNDILLKASERNAADGSERVVGFAIWKQLSLKEGYGDAPATEAAKLESYRSLYPDQEREVRYIHQVFTSFQQQREEAVKAQAETSQPSIFVLDICAVDPQFQGRGIAKQLVQWGIDEAKKRGGIDAIMEASAMGRRVYQKLGFVQEGGEIEYVVDAEFADRPRPSNIFMRLKNSAA